MLSRVMSLYTTFEMVPVSPEMALMRIPVGRRFSIYPYVVCM